MIAEQYQNSGFCLIKNFLSPDELPAITDVVEQFHLGWQQDNAEFYQQQAINSAYLTTPKYLSDAQRMVLFQLICADKINHILAQLPFNKIGFMNTQLFFNPVNPEKKNYWHRDSQYHLSIEQQKAALSGPEVIHFRLALRDEPGIELMPGTHKKWDNEQELAVRLEQNGNVNSQPLANSKAIPLQQGDLLIFSANMLHRGLYGQDRLALDIIYSEALPELLQFVAKECLPSQHQLAQLSQSLDTSVFTHTQAVLD